MNVGKTITLRSFDRGHAARTRVWMNDPDLARLLGRAKPIAEVEHERWFENILHREDCVFFSIERNDGEHIGNVWLWGIEWRHRKGEVRIVIGEPQATNCGAGTEALKMIAGYAFEQLNLHKLYAYVLGNNPRALRAFEKAGFSLEGTLHADRWSGDGYVDVYLVARLAEA